MSAGRWAQTAIKHHREQADALQAEIDQLTDPDWVAAQVRSLTRRRDQWVRLAEELAGFAEQGLWDDGEDA